MMNLTHLIPRVVAVILLLSGLFQPVVDAAKCELPVPTELGGHCGPDIGLSKDLGYDSITIRAWWFKKWRPKTTTDRADFSSTCKRHDQCYDDATDNYSGQACKNAIDDCNDQFEDDLYAECNTLPKNCQRSYCKDITADKMIGLVKLFAKSYKDEC